MIIQLDRWLAKYGNVSRRQAENLIRDGVVTINKRRVDRPETRIDPDKDKVNVNGQEITATKSTLEYIILNKPTGIVTASKRDSSNNPTVVELIKTHSRLVPVGRLDIDSEGLILLTNDGELTYRLTHPKFHLPKKYRVLVQGSVTRNKLDKLENEILLTDGQTRPAIVSVVSKDKDGVWLEFIITEGKNRQIRRMCAAVDLHVKRLIRTAIGPLKMDNLKVGKFRQLNQLEIERLLAAVHFLPHQELPK